MRTARAGPWENPTDRPGARYRKQISRRQATAPLHRGVGETCAGSTLRSTTYAWRRSPHSPPERRSPMSCLPARCFSASSAAAYVSASRAGSSCRLPWQPWGSWHQPPIWEHRATPCTSFAPSVRLPWQPRCFPPCSSWERRAHTGSGASILKGIRHCAACGFLPASPQPSSSLPAQTSPTQCPRSSHGTRSSLKPSCPARHLPV